MRILALLKKKWQKKIFVQKNLNIFEKKYLHFFFNNVLTILKKFFFNFFLFFGKKKSRGLGFFFRIGGP